MVSGGARGDFLEEVILEPQLGSGQVRCGLSGQDRAETWKVNLCVGTKWREHGVQWDVQERPM